jgi:hypothetical protein
MSTPAPLVILNAVGLTPRLLPHAPHLHALTQQGWVRPLREVWPSVTCTAQAAMLTGQPASSHGIVANGWLYRDTGEVRFWQQANTLLQAEPVYVRLARAVGRARADVPLCQAVLVVQPRGGGRNQRHAQAVLRGRWQQDFRHYWHAQWPDRATPA